MNHPSTLPIRGRRGKRAAAILLTSALTLAGLAAAPLAASADSGSGYDVTGLVTFDDTGLAGVSVELYDPNSDSSIPNQETTDDGTFDFPSVPNGDYKVYAEGDDDHFSPSPIDVHVQDGAVDVGTIALLRNHDFSGHISTSDGKALTGTTYLTLNGPDDFSLYPTVDADGNWSVSVGDSDQGDNYFYGAPQGEWTGYVSADGYIGTSLDFVNGPDGAQVTTTLQAAVPVSISGKVTAASDVSGLVATLYSYNDDSVIATATTDAAGAYTITNVPYNGDYYLYISDPQGAYARTALVVVGRDGDGNPTTYNYLSTYEDVNLIGIDVKLATSAFAGTAASVSGTTGLGGVLTVAVASTPAAGYTYQWSRNGAPIAGANGAAYTVTAADQGTTLGVTVGIAKRAFVSTTVATTIVIPAASAPATTVLKTLVKVATPKVSGAAKVGKTLKVSVKSAKTKGTTVKYQWYANGKAIKKATKSSLKLTTALKGKKLTLKVSTSKKGYTTVTKTVKIKGTVKK